MQKKEPSLCTAGADFAISSSLLPPSSPVQGVGRRLLRQGGNRMEVPLQHLQARFGCIPTWLKVKCVRLTH